MHICSSWMGLVWQLQFHSCVLEMALLHLPRLHSIHSTAGEQRHFPKHRVCTETSCSLWVEQLYPLLEVAEEKENTLNLVLQTSPPTSTPTLILAFPVLSCSPLGTYHWQLFQSVAPERELPWKSDLSFCLCSSILLLCAAHQEACPCCTSVTSHCSHQLFGDLKHSLNSNGNTLLSPLEFISFFCRCSDETQLQFPSGSGVKRLPLDTHFKATPSSWIQTQPPRLKLPFHEPSPTVFTMKPWHVPSCTGAPPPSPLPTCQSALAQGCWPRLQGRHCNSPAILSPHQPPCQFYRKRSQRCRVVK